MNDLKEEWKTVIEKVNSIYQLSNLGNARRFDKIKSKFIKINVSETVRKNQKIPQMIFGSSGGGTHYIKMSVARIFLPNPYKLTNVIHLDGDYRNCRVDNLKWTHDVRNGIWDGDYTEKTLIADRKYKNKNK